MKLRNGILRPGRVLKVLENGIINVSAPGLFSEVDLEKLPPVMPFFGLHANTYSQPLVGDEVWVLNFSDNPQQLFWFRKDDMPTNDKELLAEENVEILCNRETGMTWATIYFSDGSGWVIKYDDSKIQIRNDGTILLDSALPHRAIDINVGGISIGSIGESAHPAAYGDTTKKALMLIQIALERMQLAAKVSPYTIAIGQAIGSIPSDIDGLLTQIESPNVTID